MAVSSENLRYIVNHLFLPLELPCGDDYQGVCEHFLLNTAIDGLLVWEKHAEPARRDHIREAIATIRNIKQTQSEIDGTLIEAEVLRLLQDLTEDAPVPLYIRQQNAGVLISKHGRSVTFEVFEISPKNNATMGTKGRLRRSFPGASVVLAQCDFERPSFRETVAFTLANMSKHTISAMESKVKKAGSVLVEERDTTHPAMVSEVFIGFLRSIGKAVKCPTITKNMRDDVIWNDVLKPWHRSPSWLLVRVALQLGFNRRSTKPDTFYKEALLFILCHALICATKQGLESELLFSMNAKLARRLLKMEPPLENEALLYVQRAMQRAHDHISERWLMIQKKEPLQLNTKALSDLEFLSDCYVSVPKLDHYIQQIGHRQQNKASTTFQPPSTLIILDPHVLPQLPSSFAEGDENEAIINLQVFETWVELHCRQWSQENLAISCRELTSLIACYHQLALHHYSNNPEALSIMVLTALELWVAADESAVTLCPLLRKYDPLGIPLGVLQTLLLPLTSQLHRLDRVEKYLRHRISSSTFASKELYYNLDSEDCFPVQFFDGSEILRKARQKIISDAEISRAEKITELNELRSKYDQLIRLASDNDHTYERILVNYRNNFYETRHSNYCAKCSYQRQAEDLRIRVHEWPLPRHRMKAKSIIFELYIPPYFQSWRQATFYFLRDVIEMKYSSESQPSSSNRLCSDPHLPSPESILGDIELLSETKAHVNTHRRDQRVSTATEDNVLLSNGLNYKYYDSQRNLFVESWESTSKISEMCTYRLPLQSKSMQKYLFRPATLPNGPPPNATLADQSDTPDHMSVEEARDLAVLPLGHHIQLYNILVQLAAPSLDFRKEETTLFILQCLFQSGPPGDTQLRASHAVAGDEELAISLLDNVKNAWHRVKENWESAQALGVFSAIVTRLLSLSSSRKIQDMCINLLHILCTGAYSWVQLLREKACEAEAQEDYANFKSKSADIALICASCLDVEGSHLSRILQSKDDVSVFIQCSILIQEGKRKYDPASELTFYCLSFRFHRLLYRALNFLRAGHPGISDAVQKSWSEFHPVSKWRAVGNTAHWLATETNKEGDPTRLQVHYNLLSGELLVNGLPLSRPPRNFEAHPVWQTLFGQTAVEVMPTSAAGMQFSAKRPHKDYKLCFGMSEDLDLLVQASSSTADYEIIPKRVLQSTFPDHFIDDFVHWYDRKNDTVEFRAIWHPWDFTDDACIMSRSTKGWTLKKNGSRDSVVIALNSDTSIAIANVLFPLADKAKIHVFLPPPSDGSSLEVEVPALRLGFSLTAGEIMLQSKEFPGMWVDSDQSLGTLIGFTNKLILSNKSRRLVLVPEGQVSWTSTEGHIKVSVTKTSIKKVHPLYLDSLLGRLTDNGNVQGKLFVAYLHALTSYCLPDAFTGKTGVEQALWILKSAAVRSFDRLSQDNIDILGKIARLSPTRQFYPRHEKAMQTVIWTKDLGPLTQHEGFYKAVDAIFQQAKSMSLFFPDTECDSEQLDITKIETDKFLMERSCIRSSVFRLSDYGAEEHTTKYDKIDQGARDRNQGSTRGTNAYVLSTMLYRGLNTLHTIPLQGSQIWSIMLDMGEKITGPDQNLQLSQLRYSPEAAESGLDLYLQKWLVLHKDLSTQFDMATPFNFIMWLCALGSHKDANMGLLQIIALFPTHKFSGVNLPSIQSCYPRKGHKATKHELERAIEPHVLGINASPEERLEAYWGENWSSFESRRDEQYNDNKNVAIDTLVEHFMSQWPRRVPCALDRTVKRVTDYIHLNAAERSISNRFEEWHDNHCFLTYLEQLGAALSRLVRSPLSYDQLASVDLLPAERTRRFIAVRDLFANAAPTPPTRPPPTLRFKSDSDSHARQPSRVQELLKGLETTISKNLYEVSYIEELRASMHSLKQHHSTRRPRRFYGYTAPDLCSHLQDCEAIVKEFYSYLTTAISTNANGVTGRINGPRITPLLFLQQLRQSSWVLLSADWQACIVYYGLALRAFQRAKRLVEADIGNSDGLNNELRSMEHQAWKPLDHPEWLLLEIESRIIIRDVQYQIASEMMNPSCQRNAVMQLNMGEGKSSVIVPMVATELADGSQLARVIVAKAQSRQMLQMLVSKLGGLLNRRVYHLPFSRSLKATLVMADTVNSLLTECQKNGAVLLVQPEHLLSFQLMGIERYCDIGADGQAIGQSFIRLQDFFNNVSRDIIDESDDQFRPKFELIYTMGNQKPIELSPTRWICMQQVFDIVRSEVAGIAEEKPRSLEIIGAQVDDKFPRLRILEPQAAESLVERVARCICEKGLNGLPIPRQPKPIRDALFKYITTYKLSPEEISAVEDKCIGNFWNESTKPLVLLIRGLLAGGILAFALSRKRWRVNFGLTTDRTPPTRLAVPYRAKDSPALRSEFSHPDIVLALTSFSYYYSGLGNEDLYTVMAHLMDSDQATIEYEAWMKEIPKMPEAFRQLQGINLKDRPQCIEKVFPHLKDSKQVVDYFLSHIVFPKEMKEFPYKLSASGWDLGKKKTHYMTGFSGTKDSSKLLPSDVALLDLPSQNHTNALVLEHLLQPENSIFLLPSSTTNAERFLEEVLRLEQSTRVILDVGAQILELNNQEVAQRWLEKSTDTAVQASVFVNDQDELSIIDRLGNLELFQTSSYANQLGSCLVFLDEAHTRGIDLRLPTDYRAAVTLGANLTKDRLVQACMRMRKLGAGQSVVFCINAEIQSKIQALVAGSERMNISVQDVLHWAIFETFAETKQNLPLWEAQGNRFLRQKELWDSCQIEDGVTSMSHALAERFLEDEARSLEKRYSPYPDRMGPIASQLQTNNPKVNEINQLVKKFGDIDLNAGAFEEEQERELCPEAEQERHIQRPAPATPAKHKIHPDVVKFVSKGVLKQVSSAYMPAFDALCDTSAAEHFETSQLKNDRFLVTTDFQQAVHHSDIGIGYASDVFQRPVQWILSRCDKGGKAIDALMVISPYEAERFMPQLLSGNDTCSEVTLHLYRPRYQIGHQSFDDLAFYTIPSRQSQLSVPRALLVQLSLFSGQLYFQKYQDYLDTCEFLGLAASATSDRETVAADGYVLRDATGKSRFNKSPVRFVQALLSSIRRNDKSISRTHLGRMLEGNLLDQSDIEG